MCSTNLLSHKSLSIKHHQIPLRKAIPKNNDKKIVAFRFLDKQSFILG